MGLMALTLLPFWTESPLKPRSSPCQSIPTQPAIYPRHGEPKLVIEKEKQKFTLHSFPFVCIRGSLREMHTARWRSLLMLRDSLITNPSSQSASFHSTPVSLGKWKNKWRWVAETGRQPSKNYVRYATRQKRADAKKALKDLLFNSGSHKISFQDENVTWTADEPISRNEEEEDKQPQAKKSARKAKSHHNRNKRQQRHESFSDDYDEHPEKIFEATFGGRCFTWSFRSWEDSRFQNSTPGFEWRNDSNWKRNRSRTWETSETDDDDGEEPSVIGSYSDRTTLGLPPTGPLKMEDVKSAFRASALKWHPDKHQGPSQAMAEEKFKLCVNAYKSLCNALSSG